MRRFLLLMTGLLMTTMVQAGNGLSPKPGEAVIVLGGGCFWCLEAVYEELKGVREAVSGYAGGEVENPTYKQVTTGGTGHAEVVAVYYDPAQMQLSDLLDVYYAIHDPTTPNRQGNDVGPQYRSIAFYGDIDQKAAIDAAIARAGNRWSGRILTEVEPLTQFYAAEDYHQQYYELNGSQPYCSLVIAPKIAKFRKEFGSLRK